jgi:hypothetical protein
MTLLLRDTDTKGPEAPEASAPEAPPAAACPKCQAPVEPGQDWCLNCGEAQASRRVSLPGKRAAATVLALTTVMVGGAVAASYAALTDGSDAPPQTPTQVAQVPQPSTAAPAPVPEASTTEPPSTTTPPDPTGSVPPSTGSSGSTAPPVDNTPVTPTPSDSGTGSSGSSSSGSSSSGSSGSSSKGTDTTADTRTSTTPADTQPEPIKLDAAAATLYDPFKRDTAAGDPAKALDGDPNTSFPVTVAAGSQQIGAGLTVDLGKLRGVREIDVTTKTPGFKIEIYATDEADLPPDVLDTRWAHLKDVTGVGSDTDGKAIVSLGAGTTKYRHVLLWLTAPPTEGSTVRISELKILG